MVWLVGCGQMAQDYIKVLQALNVDFLCIGRGESSANVCKMKTNKEVFVGGLQKFILMQNGKKPSHVIVATNVESLFENCLLLLKYGIKNILLEKPGSLRYSEFLLLNDEAKKINSNIYVAYNRRFYASVLKAKELILKDGGVKSFNFDFTEWSHVIEKLDKSSLVKNKWFLCNSTHVVDLAFFLGGKPKKLTSYTTCALDWHSSASSFCGCGVSENNALFAYQSNWKSPGRWAVEILTDNYRLVFKPLEKLLIQNKGEISIDFYNDIDYALDTEYKPGLYLQLKNFLHNLTDDLCALNEQIDMLKFYYKIANYAVD
ncbi:gfo/Idh/MocA family oxidoreductase [Campylobacter lari]|uniref:gfo/Idh/MocA family oxidoreductase n=1 Tax=Campylobacter lari TaxID=201 RepID=UPI00127B6CA9|nr:gfo/Idh/MocA family oxidoreductase [Campylobacter lari]EAL3890414.1 gfo/Idh/MocA family oxidoreductase [Campylobacter lari]EHP5840905.1 gfo/Idh/MocA family oxidoreductase [Campylobacter lari]MCR2067467.1 gfo/Idh/MocA family oxidoreductase [Campylobacter lari subsp. concheus]